ncbi:MAG TPA: DUF1257 domain-containing protein [Anaerolineaceae bacterium]|jgi:hypothetical protein|nr:DUF1257 domain-containing protein [Anaerolineaceae bacterium]HOG79196.1 DUF1257 domain-containing protein [Anaerolineaceae bacterium]HQN44196.1 DUF1257 domain-containing protein [Anaerolineaceae bacterium]
MSHITRIKTKITERDYLVQALKDLGYRFEEGGGITGILRQHAEADFRVWLTPMFVVGLRHKEDSFEIVADWWGRTKERNTFVNQLNQRYAYVAARAKLEEQGFTLVEEQEEKGQIRLVLRRMA